MIVTVTVTVAGVVTAAVAGECGQLVNDSSNAAVTAGAGHHLLSVQCARVLVALSDG